jgi:alpha-L-arabinofuranosidase
MNRRDFIKLSVGAVTSAWAARTPASRAATEAAATADAGAPLLRVDPTPRHDLSPWLYMHFMEPLGVTDGSIEAAWDHANDRWRPDLVDLTKELAPGMMRWGGLFSAYYRWREAVGPRAARRPMLNLNWGGVESNQVGTAEFVDFCRRVGADPLMCVNFESEGYKPWAVNAKGDARAGDAREAAEWVDYCNNPDNQERIGHGFPQPLPIKVWQIGNETSYSDQRFNKATAIARTIEFAKAMRKADPSIKLIGWGDSGWAKDMIERAGEHLNYVAFHSLFDPARADPKSPLKGNEYRKDPAATWAALMDGYKTHERKLLELRRQVEPYKVPLALTECHYTPQGRNRCEVLSSWAAGVSYARFLNLHERHGDVLKIANIGDFCGTRWQTNAVMLPVPAGRAFAMPVAKVMALYRRHSGRSFLAVPQAPADLDVTASRTGNTFYLHVINTHRTRPRAATLAAAGMTVRSGTAFTIAADPEFEIMAADRDPMRVREAKIDAAGPLSFPAASVTALELELAPKPE